jgi:hypothetical protein
MAAYDGILKDGAHPVILFIGASKHMISIFILLKRRFDDEHVRYLELL